MDDQSPILGLTPQDRQAILDEMGVPSGSTFFQQIPENLRCTGPLDLPAPCDERQLQKRMHGYAAQNGNAVALDCYLGAGCYDHTVPAVIDAIAERGEFLTAYTPYQPEMSQGLLAALNDFTVKVAALTGLPIVTSSHYDGATALAEACWMAVRAKKKNTILVSAGLLPQYRAILDSYNWGRDVRVVALPTDPATGRTDYTADPAQSGTVAAVVLQSPNQLGVLEDLDGAAKLAAEVDALLVGAVHPYCAALGPALGEIGFDIVVMEGQPLGLHMFAGGAHLGILACTRALRPLTPGRLIGKVNDINGKPAFALVFEDREQHVARDRATSNICSNQALNALRAGAYLTLHGGRGLRDMARHSHRHARALRAGLTALAGCASTLTGDHLFEFVIDLGSAAAVAKLQDDLYDAGIFAGLAADQHPGLADNQLLISVTENKGPASLQAYLAAAAASLGEDPGPAWDAAQKVLGGSAPDGPPIQGDRVFPDDLAPMTEIALVRKYTGYSRHNFGVDTGSYPLGSCTMKYNPKRNDKLTELVGFQAVHPLQPRKSLDGIAGVYGELQGHLCALMGMDAVDLSPAAGAHGELKGLMVARRYFEDTGQHQRTEVIIPDSAHGTNPASATMVGFTCRIVGTRPDGLMDAQALKDALGDKTALVMTTNPSTFGLFEEEIEEIIAATHAAGALLYYDGANMNALMGQATPGGMGFDIAHINTHKTLSTPHGGGGPGAGPIGVKAPLAKYISAGFTADGFDHGPLQTKLFFGHISVLLRAYCYIRSMGAEGLKQATEDAVINANYLMHRLRDIIPPAFDKYCMHEALLDGGNLPITTFDLAKRMIDFGIHPPTLVGGGCVYYGEDLSQAMLFEPTESESKAEIDRLTDIIRMIVSEARQDATIAQSAPHDMPVARLDL